MNVTQKSMDELFTEIGNSLKHDSAITICGGSSIILAHKSRESTDDIDCIQCDPVVMNIANEICFQRFRTTKWFNDDVKVTQSYTPQLLQWRTPYKKFGKLMVYLISGVALLCMKLKSFRTEGNDYRDCKSLVAYCKMSGYSFDDIMNTFTQIYSSNAMLSVEAEQFLRDSFEVKEFKIDKESIQSFADMVNSNLITVSDVPKEFQKDVLNELLKDRPYAQLVQECLDELGLDMTYFDVREVLPNTELPKEILLNVLSK